jgi:hypothetical protein
MTNCFGTGLEIGNGERKDKYFEDSGCKLKKYWAHRKRISHPWLKQLLSCNLLQMAASNSLYLILYIVQIWLVFSQFHKQSCFHTRLQASSLQIHLPYLIYIQFQSWGTKLHYYSLIELIDHAIIENLPVTQHLQFRILFLKLSASFDLKNYIRNSSSKKQVNNRKLVQAQFQKLVTTSVWSSRQGTFLRKRREDLRVLTLVAFENLAHSFSLVNKSGLSLLFLETMEIDDCNKYQIGKSTKTNQEIQETAIDTEICKLRSCEVGREEMEMD